MVGRCKCTFILHSCYRTDKDSIYGARHLAQKYANTRVRGRKTEIEAIELLVLLDLLGAPNPDIYNSFPQTKHIHTRMVEIERKITAAGLFKSKRNNYFQPPDVRGHFVQDDHLPFLKRKVPVLHVIPVPFPKVWHKITDTLENVDRDAVFNWQLLIRAFVVEYLHLTLR